MLALLKRFRISWADSGEAPGVETRVLVRQRLAGVMLIGAFLALLCLPAYRQMLLIQLRAVVLQQKPEWADRNDAPRQASRRRLAAYLTQHPGDARLALGFLGARTLDAPAPEAYKTRLRRGVTYAELVPDRRLEYLEALRRRFPNDAALLTAQLRYLSQAQLQGHRSEADRTWDYRNLRDVRLAPEALRKVEQLVAEGERLEPANGFYPAMLAAAYFADWEDTKALAALRRAARCETWNDYAIEEGLAGRDLLVRTYGDAGLWMHALPSASVLLPHFAIIRRAGRMAAWNAARAASPRVEHEIRLDLLQLGHLMRHRADSLIGRLVGRSLQQMAFAGVPKQKNAPPAREFDDRTRHQRQRAAYVARVQAEAPGLAAYFRQEAAELDRGSNSDLLLGQPDELDEMLRAARYRETAGFFLLSNLLLALVAWLVAGGIWAAWRGRRELSGTEDWLWNGIRPVTRILVLEGLLAATLVPFAMVALIPDMPAGWVLLALVAFGILLLPLRRRRQCGALRESLWDGTVLTALTLGIGCLSTFPRQISIPLVMQWWGHAATGAELVTIDYTVPGFQPLALLLLPVPVVGSLLLASILLTWKRRGTLASWVLGVRLGARAMTGVLAAAYLGYLLFSVTVEVRQSRRFDQLIRVETTAPPLR